MKITKNNNPWEHYIIDDFFPTNLYNDLCDYYISNKNEDKPLSYLDVQSDDIIKLDSIVQNDLYPFLIKEGLYKDEDFKPWSSRWFFSSYEPQGRYSKHLDTESKLSSLVIYMDPNLSNFPPEQGTILYKDNKTDEGQKQIKWKPNSGLIFRRKDNITWHSYANLSLSDHRITLNHNIYR
tara:strand:- start:1832 stop:2371 length:540 start_codon:yes stop_codon:yes gene_type:complete